MIDFLFFCDIVLNFRTSFNNIQTGDEITNSKQIAINYIQGRFWIDMASSVPFEVIIPAIITDYHNNNDLALFSMLKLIRVLRLGRMITYLNETDDVKLSLRLFKLCFFLILYIHVIACVWFYVCNIDKDWLPPQYTYYGKRENLFNTTETDASTQYLVSFYCSLLALTGNDLYPKS